MKPKFVNILKVVGPDMTTQNDGGTATAGTRGTATAGDGGVISILFYDESRETYRRLAAEVGVTPGIEPNKKYRVENGRFMEVEE